MKKIIMVIALILWGVFFYTQLRAGEMEDVMLSIEKDMDTCIESNDKDVCESLSFNEDYMIKFMGNSDYMKEFAKCKMGDECYSIMIRLASKSMTALRIQIGLND
jgi:hypothetical protein